MRMFASTALAFHLAISPTHAQLTLDVSKVTCEQFSGYRIASPKEIAIWLSGYYNGKRDNAVIDIQELRAMTERLEEYCIGNPNTNLMQAVDVLFRPQK